MSHNFTFEAALADSERIHWRVEDLIGDDKRLDFSKPFLPDSLAGAEPLSFLSPREQLTVNQIRGHGYLHTFSLVEEFILPFVLDHTRPQLDGGDLRVRAFLQFANDEAKHIDLFKRFRRAFERDFGSTCEVIGPPREFSRTVLAHHPLAVALVILHVEWMTQRHYLESVKNNQDLDPCFASLLKHHWMEEAQHAKLDTLMVESLAETCSADEVTAAVEEYIAIAGLIDGGLMRQIELDLDSFARATGRRLSEIEQEAYRTVQRRAIRWTFLGSGMTHPQVLRTLQELHSDARVRVERVAPAFC
jgi:hypothetical protein